jgi:hypothetical protein
VFVRRKKVKGNIYYQLVRSIREDGKHRQKILCHLGRHKSLEASIAAERALAEHHERESAYWSEEAQDTKDLCLEEYAQEFGGDFPSRKQAYLRWRAFWGEYNKTLQSPYYTWLNSLEGWTSGEWERWQKTWIEREEFERQLLERVYQHRDEQDEARRHNKWAAAHRTRLNKFLECQRKYF